MWWKLSLLALGTIGIIAMSLPIRTHAVLYRPDVDPIPDTSISLRQWIASVYFTPGAMITICAVLVIAVGIGWRIVRSG